MSRFLRSGEKSFVNHRRLRDSAMLSLYNEEEVEVVNMKDELEDELILEETFNFFN